MTTLGPLLWVFIVLNIFMAGVNIGNALQMLPHSKYVMVIVLCCCALFNLTAAAFLAGLVT